MNTLIVPGYHGSDKDHWQTWLEQQIPSAKRVSGIDWEQPIIHKWADAIVHELDASIHKTVIVAHSFGCLASAMAIAKRPEKVAGVIFVAPADPQRFSVFGARQSDFTDLPSIAGHLPDHSLKTTGILIGSRDDPWMELQHAYAWSKRWDLIFHDAGNAGHINVESGFGPWPLIKLITDSLRINVEKKRSWHPAEVIAAHKSKSVVSPAFTLNQPHLLYA